MKKILVSACLLGIPCRYDGKSNPNQEVISLKDKFELIPICPEVLGRLPTPRIPAEIQGERVVRSDGVDVTLEYIEGAKKALEIAKEKDCDLAILKAKSPSCGNREIYDGTYTKTLIKGKGITVKLFEKNGITVINESEIHKLK
ncbi:MAG: DUF523 domain-containing protein [Clostridia bacterium]|nr:DUF523 domain-containing protein [Clostridia bacterium]